MPYPPAPWKAKGFVVQTLHLIDVEKARLYVPAALEIVSVLPGKTLGAVCLADYGPGSALEYKELVIAAALTRHCSKLRFWVSHIYVDNTDSMAGGREIWGLPKEMAQFTWRQDRPEIEVRQDEQLLCRTTTANPRWLLPAPNMLPFFSILDTALLSSVVTVRGRVGVTCGHLDVPDTSPFRGLNLAPRGYWFAMRNIRFIARAPRVVAKIS